MLQPFTGTAACLVAVGHVGDPNTSPPMANPTPGVALPNSGFNANLQPIDTPNSAAFSFSNAVEGIRTFDGRGHGTVKGTTVGITVPPTPGPSIRRSVIARASTSSGRTATTTAMIATDRSAMRLRRAGLRRSRRAAALLMVACGASGAGHAGVLVEGTPAAVRVTADQAAIADVLTAMAENFHASYRSAIPLDAPAGPAYAGSLAQVIARVLDGYNYVVKRNGPATDIVVFGRRGEIAIPPPAPKAPPTGLLSRWR